MSLSDMVTQHLQACWGSGTNPPGDDTAALNFWVLWGTRDSHWHFILPLPACAQDLPFSLPFLIKKQSMLYDYPCGWNARQNNTRGLFDVVPGIHQQMPLIHYVLELWEPLHPSTDIYWPHSLPVRRALSYLFFLVHIKTGCGRDIVHPCHWMPWKNNFPWDFCWISWNSLVDGAAPLSSQIIQGPKHSHWHLLNYLFPVPQDLYSFSLNKTGCAWVTLQLLNALTIHLSQGFLLDFK